MLKNSFKTIFATFTAILMITASGSYAGIWTSSGPAALIPLPLMVGSNFSTGGGHMNDSDIFHVVEARAISVGAINPLGLTLDSGVYLSPTRLVNIDYFFAQGTTSGLHNYTTTLTSAFDILGTVTGGNSPPAMGILPPGSVSFYPTDPVIAFYGSNGSRWLESNDTAAILVPNNINVSWNTYTVQDAMRVFTVAPEPSTYMVLGGTLGLAMLLMLKRRRKLARN